MKDGNAAKREIDFSAGDDDDAGGGPQRCRSPSEHQNWMMESFSPLVGECDEIWGPLLSPPRGLKKDILSIFTPAGTSPEMPIYRLY